MNFRSEYQSLDDNEAQFSMEIHSKIRWDHIQNLDKFFSNVYYFHQQSGFYVTFIEFILQILKFFFIIWILSVLVNLCFFDFEVIRNGTILYNRFYDPIIFKSQNNLISAFVGLSLFLLLLFIIISIPKLKQFYSISKFYSQALKITDDVIPDKMWSDVMNSLEEIQKDLQLCVHKRFLSKLDIYQRILRRQNYLIAMVNHEIFPTGFHIPFYGEFVIVTKYYLDSIKFLLFKFPFRCPFGDHWQLRSEYKNIGQRKALADELYRLFFIMGLFQIFISPFCFFYLLITKACTYGHGLRINPGYFINRDITPLGRLTLSHFNELPHEFSYRISKAYPPVNQYLDSFTSKITTALARLLRFLTGGIVVVGFIISMVNNQFLLTSPIITYATLISIVYSVSTKLIPDESVVVNPKLLIIEILSHIHYVPDDWKDKAHTRKTYYEVSKLFQPKLLNIFKELLSCFWSPIIFILWMPKYSYKFVDFFRNYTAEINGVGDICSFAQMDLFKHGSPSWCMDESKVNEASTKKEDDKTMMKNGKIELSLMNFHVNNPDCSLGKDGDKFVGNIKHNLPTLHSLAENTIYEQFGDTTEISEFHLKNANKVVGSQISQLSSLASTSNSSPHPNSSSNLKSSSISNNNRPQSTAAAYNNYFQQNESIYPNIPANQSILFDNYRSLHYESFSRDLARSDVNMSICLMHSIHDRQRRLQHQQSHQSHQSHHGTEIINEEEEYSDNMTTSLFPTLSIH